jgi:hypothetical protein
MQIATILIFLALITSAPWISREWGRKGELIWVIITLLFIFTALAVLE